ncbi:MAG: FkbW [uncultured Rubrobacteraceae bacterium]|uniref:FkbW n=1 Tax=uncultured Rubrobacteraceae bacterium TaxID=349277 RepID=A0A6J4RYN7_9ACTN|nr:MAG: FkbW [uncultured Rubrobacteraceae bacterium]
MVRRGGSYGGPAGAGAHVSRRSAASPGARVALAMGFALVLSLLAVVLTAAVSGPAGAQALPDTGGELEPPAEDTGFVPDPNLPTDDAGDSGSNSKSCRVQDDGAEGLVPGAPEQDADCLQDLTTAGTQETGHTNRQDWENLHADGTRNPSGVPGLQVDGYFPDDSSSNQNNGYDHDSQFVIRFPNDWNGKLVITGAPGVRRQYANDFIMSDFFLAKGYAFAATDKGNTGIGFYEDGQEPGDAVAEGHRRVEELTRATKKAASAYYGKRLDRTYITGISNGGYLTRYALENTPELYDGGVDWEGTLYRAQGPNLFTWLPVALRNYPDYEASGGDRQGEAYENMIEGGYARGSEFLWEDHYAVYWDLTQRIYREEFDPNYDGARGEGGTPPGVPFCQDETNTPGCDANYQYGERPQGVKDAVQDVSLTGNIGKPMITLHGDLDALLPIRTDSDPYRKLIKGAGEEARHRYLVIGRGNHVDGLYDDNPDKLRPILPCYRDAFVALDRSVDGDGRLPDNGFIRKPKDGDVVNDCNFNSRDQRPDRGPR